MKLTEYVVNTAKPAKKLKMKDTSRPLDDSSWNPGEEACDAEAQRKVDDRHINQLFSDMFSRI
jgi:hypothetical protein